MEGVKGIKKNMKFFVFVINIHVKKTYMNINIYIFSFLSQLL